MVGSLNLNESNKIDCVSPSYTVFRIKGFAIDPKYLHCLFNLPMIKEQIKNFCFGGGKTKFKFW